MATHSSILTWRIPWTEGTVPGVTKSQTRLDDYTCTLTAMKGDITSTTIVVGNFKPPINNNNRSSRQKITKEAQTLNERFDQIDLIGIQRGFHPKAAEYTFSSNAHRTFSKTDHILGHKFTEA